MDEKNRLFRKKSEEYIDSPEKLDAYLQVTSPGIWVLLLTIIVILAGICVWGIFGRLESKRAVAVWTENGQSICYVPEDVISYAVSGQVIECEGQKLALVPDEVTPLAITEDMNAYILLAGELKAGDIVYEIAVNADLEEGVHQASLLTESISPMSLLFN